MRLIIISNRLPLTITKTNSTFSYKETSGGLVTGLKAVKQTLQFIWLGNISGMSLKEVEKNTITKDCWDLYKSIPVFIEKELNEASYNGFCNGIMWPLLHSFPDDVAYDPKMFEAYNTFNKIFCDRVVEIAEEDDVIWVHDYHLMLLPQMLRDSLSKKLKNFSIGFFLHVPFSPSDVFRTLPCAKEILRGILGSDHIAFHIYDYLGHFLETCDDLLPLESDFTKTKRKAINKMPDPTNHIDEKQKKINYFSGDIKIGKRKIHTKAIPIGIDPELFRATLKKSETKARIAELKKKFNGKMVVIGVDRTDFIKGIPNRIRGFQKFLMRENTNKNIVFLQICVPSRLDVPEYGSLMETINTMAAELNGSIGNVDDTYFHILSKSVKFEELCALYSVADICVISSILDGMNLVALEYVSCQQAKKGVLMLSEFAGCSSTLPGSYFFNPWNIDEMANAFEACIEMSEDERADRYEINVKNVEKFTAVKWAEDNVKLLQTRNDPNEKINL